MPSHRGAWAGAATLSLCLHVGWWLKPHSGPTPDSAATASGAARTVAISAAAVVRVRASRLPDAQTQALAPTLPPAVQVPTTASLQPTAAPRHTTFHDDQDDVAYLPRSALTVAPRALTPVLLTIPPGVPEGRYQAELTLYIDEEGRVRRVRVDTAGLLPELEDQARQAFVLTRFTPGEVGKKPVRSRLRVAVEFEALEPARSTGVPTP